MFYVKFIAVVMFASLLLFDGQASACQPRFANSQANRPASPNFETSQAKELKVLAEGFHSNIQHPFVGVFRDSETYYELTRLDSNLPKLDEDFFKSNIVVAAFLGERNTGGYGVEITQGPIDINVLEKKPAKGSLVPQMITTPFKLVTLDGVGNAPVRLTLDSPWTERAQSYRVMSGKFVMSGGIAGRSEEFGVEGFVHVIREGNLISFHFRVVASGASKRRLLMDYATGIAENSDRIRINRMSADSFVDQPTSGLKATADFKEGQRKLSLVVLSRPSLIADGYSGVGNIEAELGKVNPRSNLF